MAEVTSWCAVDGDVFHICCTFAYEYITGLASSTKQSNTQQALTQLSHKSYAFDPVSPSTVSATSSGRRVAKAVSINSDTITTPAIAIPSQGSHG